MSAVGDKRARTWRLTCNCSRMRLGVAPIFVSVLVAMGLSAEAQQRTDEAGRQETVERRRGLLNEPRFITQAVDEFDRRAPARGREPKDGFYLELGNMITGAGWLTAGPGYRRHVFEGRAIASASGAVSVRLYRMAQGSLEFPHLANNKITLGAQTIFRDALQVNYFGLGNDSLESSRSGYRLRTNDLTAYGSVGGPAFALRAQIGWLQPLSVGPMGRDAVYPDTVALFSERDAPGLEEPPTYLHAAVALSADTRDYAGHPTSGGSYQVVWSGYADERMGRHSFQRYEANVSHYTPLTANWVLALGASAAISRVREGQTVPFYVMANLGGRNNRGFTDYRFHDLNMQSYSVESRWGLFSHLDAAAFVDLGSVAQTPRQLKFGDLKPSYGAGFRLHNNRVTIARIDVAHSVEGWRLMFKMNDPFRRTTQSNGWRPVAPFVP